MSLTAKHILVKGKVQGVFFRKTAKQVADELHVAGWVKNTDEGHVEILAQATKEAMEKLIKWCRQGPPKADVIDVIINDAELNNSIKEFYIDR